MRSFIRHLALIVFVFLGGLSASFAAQPDPDAMRARIEQQWQDMVQRLQLSDEQIAAAKPIVEEHTQARMTILSDFRAGLAPGQKPSRGTLMTLRDQMQASRAAMRADLAPILTPEQLAELDAIQDERRAAMREKIRNGDFNAEP
ncbi:MAG: hypothetical protein GC199_11525 [Alphaproteobacteria bacterium]|nr:hypothetical protein [Alphaproteobacteria bacterium]